jgi:polysaccharide biosynthesis transport protein
MSKPGNNKPDSERSSGGEGYRYGYGEPDYAGYGPGEGGQHKSFRDYFLVIRERIWYIIVVFLVVFSATLVYTLSQTKIYKSVASVQLLRSSPTVLKVEEVLDQNIRGQEDFNTQVKLFESGQIIQRVADRLTPDETRKFMKPYEQGTFRDPVTPIEVIARNRRIIPVRLTFVVAVEYAHPDPLMAARIANLFVDEFISYNSRTRIEESMKAVEDLKVRAEQQRKKVEEITNKLQEYKEASNLVSLDQRKDIVTEKLKMLNMMQAEVSARFRDAEVRWQFVRQYRESGQDISDLAFIAAIPAVAQLKQQVGQQKVLIAQLSERYRARHPRMVEAMNAHVQTETELQRALTSAAAAVENEFLTSRRNLEEARSLLAEQETEALRVDRLSLDYANISREAEVNEFFYQNILLRMRETTVATTLETQSARLMDRAVPALTASSPNIPMNLGLGFIGGLGLGLAFAFFIAFIDDRVKSAFDIEAVIGLPLLGIIPQLGKMEHHVKSQIVANNEDRQVAEAFRTLHSSLKLHNESKNAQVILVTSTIPGEGKSFTSTNLALAFAAHGERTLIIDCDLRKPNISRSFKLENNRGLIDLCTEGSLLDEVVHREVHPNLDVLTSGGRAKQPTQILNGKEFEALIGEARKKYDRVIVDTPPLAAVSDALIVLPLVDGSIFTVHFNRVRRKTAQFIARRLTDSNVPVFGAILNGLNLAVSGYYYEQYYGKSYKDYYVVASPDEPNDGSR